MAALLEVRHLKTYFSTENGLLKAVDDVSFSIEKGRILGIVGESGSGKSITSLSVMRLVECPPGIYAGGEILFKGRDLLKLSKSEMRSIRGNDIAMVFQEPMTSLNPVYTVGEQISEAIVLHQRLSRAQARRKTIEMLQLVNIPSPEKRVKEYPHQLSGGMRQRVMIAMALCCNPELLICDEPTTALDVTIQAQILELINELRDKVGASVILITHALGVVAEVADHVMVMYCGKVMEYCDVFSLFANPMHPYTQGLLRSIPRLDQNQEKLSAIPGMVPRLSDMPSGCPFHPRCDCAKPICSQIDPESYSVGDRSVRCLKYSAAYKSYWPEER